MRIAVISGNHKPLADAISAKLEGCVFDCYNSLQNNLSSYDLIISTDKNTENNTDYNVLCSHYSLLPAFDTDTPVKDAMLEGVKVTGISIYFTNPKRIIAQYPVFINNDLHYDELLKKLEYIEQVFYPLVIEKILNNEPIESQTLLQNSSCGSCGSCKQCSK